MARLMHPIRISIANLPIPFRSAFVHASAIRRRAENLIVRVEDEGGRVGLGEACPRTYVSGETPASAATAIARWRPALLRIHGVDGLRQWLARCKHEIDRAPSAACAVELALLDMFARQAGRPVEDLLGGPRLDHPLPVTAVYGGAPAPLFLVQHNRFLAAGMTDSKLKLSGRNDRDARRAARLARRGRVRLDANNLWPDAGVALAGLKAAGRWAWAVEEPVRPRDWHGLARVGRESGLAVILDESFTGPSDLKRLEPGPRYLVNLRLSRLGGLLRTLDALAAAEAAGVGVILGAHVGEISLLARAGLAVAAEAGARLDGYEGAYGTRLLKHDPAAPSLTFGSDGFVRPGREWRPDAPGWGLDLHEPVPWREP
jgi:L-alanine-DL-glutamate epimerase-like enolase superfamily enzyme